MLEYSAANAKDKAVGGNTGNSQVPRESFYRVSPGVQWEENFCCIYYNILVDCRNLTMTCNGTGCLIRIEFIRVFFCFC